MFPLSAGGGREWNNRRRVDISRFVATRGSFFAGNADWKDSASRNLE